MHILTLNLNYRVAKHGAWPERRALIANAARERGVDVMVLQAVEGSEGSNQATELAALLNLEHVTFIAAMNEGDVMRGSAFVSRYPLSDVAVQPLTRRDGHGDPNQRVVVRAAIETGQGRVDLYNAHFSWIRDQAAENAREALAFHRPGASLLLGDLNSPPDTLPVETLQEAGWCDVWAELRPGDPGYTFESDRPTQRIDYIFANGSARAQVRAIDRVVSDGQGPPRLSDHAGLLVTLDGEEART